MRFRQRHLHATIVGHIRSALTTGGWLSEPVNFGTTPVTLLDYEPQQAGETPAFNTVAVSIGHQGADEDFELGGGLATCSYTVFVDIYGESEPIGVAIGDDIKDCLTNMVVALRDFTADPAGVEVEAQIEFEDVMVETLTSAASTLDKRSWRAVKATAVCFF
jgi:hypothetical protein